VGGWVGLLPDMGAAWVAGLAALGWGQGSAWQ
jgi:hypothetical protein